MGYRYDHFRTGAKRIDSYLTSEGKKTIGMSIILTEAGTIESLIEPESAEVRERERKDGEEM